MEALIALRLVGVLLLAGLLNSRTALSQTIPLASALNTTNLVWSTPRDCAWAGQTNVTHDDRAAAVSADVPLGGSSVLRTEVAGPGLLGFWWACSGSGGDRTVCRVDGFPRAAIGGDADWTHESLPLHDGLHTVEWVYENKDGTTNEGGRAWLDEVTNELAFTRLGGWPDAPRLDARALMITNHLVYLAACSGGLAILDVSDPAQPRWVGGLRTEGNAVDVVVSGTTAYVADEFGGLRIIDVTSPLNPHLLGVYRSAAPVRHVRVQGRFAYITTACIGSDCGLEILDVEDPAVPVRVAQVPYCVVEGSLDVVGNYVYTSADLSGVRVFDVSTPAAPVQVALMDLDPWEYTEIRIVGTKGYMVGGLIGAIAEFDATDPSRPGSPQTSAGFDDLSSVDAAGPYMVVADRKGALMIMGHEAPFSFTVVGSVTNLISPQAVRVQGDFAYVADGPGGLKVLDISRPEAPRLAGALTHTGLALDVGAENGKVYVADSKEGVRLLDVSNPAAPELLATFDTRGTARAVSVSGHRLFVADGLAGVHALDVSDANHPLLIGTYNTPGDARDLQSVGNLVFVADGPGGFLILDFLNAPEPRLLARVAMEDVRSVEIIGTDAYVGDRYGMAAIDVKDPGNPVRFVPRRNYYWGSAECTAVHVGEGVCFMAFKDRSMVAYGLSPNREPTWITQLTTRHEVIQIETLGNLLFLAEGGGGIEVFRRPAEGRYDFVTTLATPGPAQRVRAEGNTLLAACDAWGMVAYRGGWAAFPPQVLDFDVPPAVSLLDPVLDLSATSSSGLPVVITLLSGPARLEGNRCTATNTGMVTLRAEQAGNGLFAPAFVERSIRVFHLGDALDVAQDSVSTSTDQPWKPQSAITHDGLDAAQSAPVADGHQTVLRHAVTGPGTLGFWWKVSSEAERDFLVLAVDGIRVDEISGDTPWLHVSLPLAEGSHSVEWTYAKDDGGKSGLDTAWVDDVRIDRPFAITGSWTNYPPGQPTSIRVAGNTAFLTSVRWVQRCEYDNPDVFCFDVNESSLTALDVSHPEHPLVVGTLGLRNPGNLLMEEGLLYLLDGGATTVIDVRERTRLIPLTSTAEPVPESGYPSYYRDGGGLAIEGTTACVTPLGPTLQTVDVRDPAHPTLLGQHPLPAHGGGLDVKDGFAFVASGAFGVQIVDVSRPEVPVQVGAWKGSGFASDVHLVGARLYVAEGAAGLRVLDVSDPSRPLLLGTYRTGGVAARVQVIGQRAFVACGVAGLQIVDVADPSNPVRIGGCGTGGGVRDVHVDGHFAYLAEDNRGLVIVDLAPLLGLRPPQSLDFEAVTSQRIGIPFQLTATASSGLPVTFRVVQGPAVLMGNTCTLAGPGEVVVRAEQAGDATHAAAFYERRFLDVQVAVPTLHARRVPEGVECSWLAVAAECVLESTDSLQSPAVWRRVSAAPARVGGSWRVLLATTEEHLFLRLSRVSR